MTDTRSTERAIAIFGTWSIIGLHLDGWAHIHQKPETFFTPWHGVLYSGFGAAVAFFAIRDFFRRGQNTGPDNLTLIGFGIFAVGAFADFGWHALFGIEVSLAALLSPTHLFNLIGGLLMLAGPARMAWRRPTGRDITLKQFWPAATSWMLVAAVSMFFTQYLNALRWQGVWQARGQEVWEVVAVGSVFVTNAIMMGVTLLIVRRWKAPFGTFLLLFTVLAAFSVGLDSFDASPNIIAAAVAGLVADLLVRALDPSPERIREVRIFAVVVPVVLWGMWFVAMIFQEGVHWGVNLWTGTIILAALSTYGLSVLVFPPKIGPAPEPPPPMGAESLTESLA